MRLDKYLYINKRCESRNKATNLIVNNQVLVNDKVVSTAHYDVKDSDIVVIIENDNYVSRGAYKLLEAINTWKIDFKNKVIVDIGTSTGGFTDVALRNKAKLVYAIDVGTNQLHKSLKNNSKVISYENMHFNDLKEEYFKQKIDWIVADLSFISLTKLIDKLQNLFNYKYSCIFLIKPQFELTKKEIKSGKVSSIKLQEKAVNKIKNYALTHNFKCIGVIKSPILGNKLGNQEYLIYLEKK